MLTQADPQPTYHILGKDQFLNITVLVSHNFTVMESGYLKQETGGSRVLTCRGTTLAGQSRLKAQLHLRHCCAKQWINWQLLIQFQIHSAVA